MQFEAVTSTWAWPSDPVWQIGALAWVAEGRAIVLPDVREDTPPARAYRAIMGDLAATPAFSFVVSIVSVKFALARH